MSWIAAATIGGGLLAANSAKSAASTAAGAQTEAAQLGIDEQRRQFDKVQELLAPYVQAGEGGLSGQLALAGVSGPEAEQAQIDRILAGPQFNALVQQGEEGILQNAAATGGLRGGNTQGALAQFRPQILSQLIDQQFGRLGGLSGLGQASAAGVGAAGQATGANISNLLAQQGAAQAGGALAAGQANVDLFGSIGSGIGSFLGQGGFSQFGGGGSGSGAVTSGVTGAPVQRSVF